LCNPARAGSSLRPRAESSRSAPRCSRAVVSWHSPIGWPSRPRSPSPLRSGSAPRRSCAARDPQSHHRDRHAGAPPRSGLLPEVVNHQARPVRPFPHRPVLPHFVLGRWKSLSAHFAIPVPDPPVVVRWSPIPPAGPAGPGHPGRGGQPRRGRDVGDLANRMSSLSWALAGGLSAFTPSGLPTLGFRSRVSSVSGLLLLPWSRGHAGLPTCRSPWCRASGSGGRAGGSWPATRTAGWSRRPVSVAILSVLLLPALSRRRAENRAPGARRGWPPLPESSNTFPFCATPV